MKPEAQRIAIAEACGFVEQQPIYINGVVYTRMWRRDGWPLARLEALPHYLADLNAMHEAEKVLTKYQKRTFGELLQSAVNGVAVGWTSSYEQQLESLADIAHATAAQRAEAFLRTIGKWGESK